MGWIIFPLLLWVLSWDLCNKRRLLREKQTDIYKHVYLMYTWERAKGKWVIERGGSGFRLKYYSNKEELMLLNCGAGEDSFFFWRRLLRVPCTAGRSNQSILKEINPEYSLEAQMLKLKFWLPDVKNWLIGKDPDAEKDWRQEEKGATEEEMVGWHHWLNGLEFE